jgi:hypothetical protein
MNTTIEQLGRVSELDRTIDLRPICKSRLYIKFDIEGLIENVCQNREGTTHDMRAHARRKHGSWLRAEKLAPWQQATVDAHFCAGRVLLPDVEAESVVCACENQDCGVGRAEQCQLDKREAQKCMLICSLSSCEFLRADLQMNLGFAG